jgi:hypothetical protein
MLAGFPPASGHCTAAPVKSAVSISDFVSRGTSRPHSEEGAKSDCRATATLDIENYKAASNLRVAVVVFGTLRSRLVSLGRGKVVAVPVALGNPSENLEEGDRKSVKNARHNVVHDIGAVGRPVTPAVTRSGVCGHHKRGKIGISPTITMVSAMGLEPMTL